MIERLLVRKGAYHDSARLMAVSRALKSLPGIRDAEVLMGTPMNIDLLAGAGFRFGAGIEAAPLDLVAALRGEEEKDLGAAEAKLDEMLRGEASPTSSRATGEEPASLPEALAERPGANVVSIAVPGAYAAYVAHRALDAGRHVFLFSDNVSLEDEIGLKDRARSLGLLLMGPDCGTAILAGVGFGFANRVRRGPIGIVGASGTGIQEAICLLDRLGVGISHAIGTGGRDLSEAVGGRTAESGLRLLSEDPETRVLLLVAKRPDRSAARRLHGLLAGVGKPCVVRFLGEEGRPPQEGVAYAGSLDEAAMAAAAYAGGATGARGLFAESEGETDAILREKGPVRGRLLGLFGGGSLAAEARHVLAMHGIETETPDRPLPAGKPIEGAGHLIVDAGEDFYTVGRPHPMVDQTVRCDLIRTSGADRSNGLLLLDLVLGDGAHLDPAPEIAAAVEEARAAREGARFEVVSSVTGAAGDPQDRERQEEVLRGAGVRVAASAARAARAAARLLWTGKGESA
ncbi:MAG: acyl-CoA synthetase FdrA [Candidatus Eisenbacteria bacterium]